VLVKHGAFNLFELNELIFGQTCKLGRCQGGNPKHLVTGHFYLRIFALFYLILFGSQWDSKVRILIRILFAPDFNLLRSDLFWDSDSFG